MRDQPVSVAGSLANVGGMARVGLELVAKPEEKLSMVRVSRQDVRVVHDVVERQNHRRPFDADRAPGGGRALAGCGWPPRALPHTGDPNNGAQDRHDHQRRHDLLREI